MIVELTDPTDPRVADFVSLTDVKLRRKLEPEHGLFIAEGAKVIARALAAGYALRSMLLEPKWLGDLAEVVERADRDGVTVYVGTPAVIEQVTGYAVHRGALASMQRRPLPMVDDVLAGARRIAVLEDLVDHANVGAAFRNAAALGVDAVLLSPRCADPLYRRAVKVSMGAVLQIPWTRIENWPAGLPVVHEHGFVVAGMTLADDAITLDELVMENHAKLALVFGTEGDGLSAKVDRMLDRRVKIPMMGGIDSLNVAASSAVAFYATR